jgi:hypothetical protein
MRAQRPRANRAGQEVPLWAVSSKPALGLETTVFC